MPADQAPRLREARCLERFVRNYLEYRRTLPHAGIRAALRRAWQDPVLPYLVRKRRIIQWPISSRRTPST